MATASATSEAALLPRHAAAWPALVLVAALAQGAILWGNFYLDDYFYLHLARAGAGPFAPFVQDLWFGIYFRPGFFPLFWLCHLIFGAHAVGYFALNLALVTGTSLLIFAGGRRLFGSPAVAFWAAALFAASPATTMGAHFIFNTPDVLGAFLLVFSLFALGRSLAGGGLRWRTMSLAAAFWAMSCKENQIVVAPLALLLAWSVLRPASAPRRTALIKTLKTVWPYFALAALYLVWRTAVLGGPGGYASIAHPFSLGQVTGAAAKLTADYFTFLPWLTAALALAAVAVAFFGRPRLALVGLLAAVVMMAPMALNLKNPVMALWFPLRFFYLGGLGVAVLLAAGAAAGGKRGLAAQAILGALTLSLMLNAAPLAWDFSQWQQRRVAEFERIGAQIISDHPDLEPGTVVYYCVRPHDHALDAGVKFFHPELTNRVLLSYCNDRTEFVAGGDLPARMDVSMNLDPMLKKNPTTYGDIAYGITLTNLRQVQTNARRPGRVLVLAPPSAPDPQTDHFFPLGVGRPVKPVGF